MIMGEVKTCKTCGQTMPTTEFGRNKAYKDGLQPRCRPCQCEKERAYRKANPEVGRKAALKWRNANLDQARANYMKWAENNPDKVQAKKQRFAEAHREEIAQATAEWRSRPGNPGRNRENAQRWRQNPSNAQKQRDAAKEYRQRNAEAIAAYWAANPEKLRAKTAKRRALKRQSGVYTITDKDVRRLYASPCWVCGSTNDIHADHRIPLSKGGRHSIGNLDPLCADCNLSKHDKLLAEWRYRTRI